MTTPNDNTIIGQYELTAGEQVRADRLVLWIDAIRQKYDHTEVACDDLRFLAHVVRQAYAARCVAEAHAKNMGAVRDAAAREATDNAAQLAGVTQVLSEWAQLEGPCRRDHHGRCQAHYVERDCIVARARAALGNVPAAPLSLGDEKQ